MFFRRPPQPARAHGLGLLLLGAWALPAAGADPAGPPPAPPNRLAPVTADGPLIMHTLYACYTTASLAGAAGNPVRAMTIVCTDEFYEGTSLLDDRGLFTRPLTVEGNVLREAGINLAKS